MLAYHILIPVFCGLVMNGIIFSFNLNSKKELTTLLPPGHVIGIVWTIIFAFLGYVHYLLYKLNNKRNYGSASVVILILFSLTYPLINAMNKKNGFFLNLISLILSFLVSLIVMMYSKYIVLFMIPLLVWVSFVNLIVFYNIIYTKRIE